MISKHLPNKEQILPLLLVAGTTATTAIIGFKYFGAVENLRLYLKISDAETRKGTEILAFDYYSQCYAFYSEPLALMCPTGFSGNGLQSTAVPLLDHPLLAKWSTYIGYAFMIWALVWMVES